MKTKTQPALIEETARKYFIDLYNAITRIKSVMDPATRSTTISICNYISSFGDILKKYAGGQPSAYELLRVMYFVKSMATNDLYNGKQGPEKRLLEILSKYVDQYCKEIKSLIPKGSMSTYITFKDCCGKAHKLTITRDINPDEVISKYGTEILVYGGGLELDGREYGNVFPDEGGTMEAYIKELIERAQELFEKFEYLQVMSGLTEKELFDAINNHQQKKYYDKTYYWSFECAIFGELPKDFEKQLYVDPQEIKALVNF